MERGGWRDKFVGNELSISNVVMKGSIYVMTRHNEPSGLCTQQSVDSGHMMVVTIYPRNWQDAELRDRTVET